MVNPAFHDAVHAIYDVPEQPESVGSALAAIGRFLGTPHVHLLTYQQDRMRILATERAGTDRLAALWSSRDIGHLLANTPQGQVVDARRWVGHGGLPWPSALAAVVPAVPDTDITALIVPLESKDGDAQCAVQDKLQQLLPHLRRAIVLWRRLDDDMPTVKATTQLVRDLPLPTLLTDGDGRCIETNGAFAALKSSLAAKVVSGRLAFRDEYLQDSWQSALRETAETAIGRRLLADSGSGRQWKVHLQPFPCIPSARSFDPKNFVLAVFEEHAPVPYADPERMATVSKLTRAEQNVLSGLLQGLTGKVIARSRNASVNTVRSQIMSILTKTGHHSQKELIASFHASSFDPNSVFNEADRV